jgi:hypothetical protein
MIENKYKFVYIIRIYSIYRIQTSVELLTKRRLRLKGSPTSASVLHHAPGTTTKLKVNDVSSRTRYSKSSPECRRNAFAARGFLLLCTLLLTSCEKPDKQDASLDRFRIITDEGPVLAIVNGSATGFTNHDLTQLIRAGVAEAYSILCDVSPDPAAERQMVWHVVNDGRKPTAVVPVHIVQSGQIVRSAFASVAAPDSNPDAIFKYDVAHLARRVLPAGAPVETRPTGCT